MALTRIQTAALQSSITGSNITDGSIAPADLSTGRPFWDTSSNLAIGHSSPDRPVHLKSSGNRNYIKAETTVTSNSNEAGFEVKTPVANFLIGSLGNTNALWVYDVNATAERLRIDSSGNLLVGIATSPTHSTTGMFIGTSGNRGVSWSYSSDTHYVRLESSVIDGITINGYSGVAFATGSRTNSTWTERMRLEGGNLLIGTTTAVDSSKVQIIGAKAFSSGIPQGQFNVADSTAYAAGVGGAIAFGGKYHSAGFYTTFASIEGVKENATDNHYSGNLVFRVRLTGNDNIERMRINADGNLLVGGTSAGSMSAPSGSSIVVANSGGILSTSGTIANNGTLVLNLNSGGGAWAGFLVVSNTYLANAAIRTSTTYSAMGRTLTGVLTQIASNNGTTGGCSFTLAYHGSNYGQLVMTNTSGGSAFMTMMYMGSSGG
jgi:hypothetical protein